MRSLTGQSGTRESVAQFERDGGMWMIKRLGLLTLVLSVGMIFAVGCGGGSSSSKTAQLRMVNAVGDSAGYDTLVAGVSFATDLAFNNATAYASVTSGSEQIEFRNTGTTTDVINQTVTLTGATNNTYVAMGTSAQPAGAIFTDTSTAATSGDFQLRIINGSTYISSADVYIVPSTGNCSAGYLSGVSANISGLQFGSASAYKTLTAGSYYLCVTASATKTAYYYGGSSAYASGAVETIIIEDYGGTGPLQIQTLTDATS
jgi:hypothetical protein